MQCVQQNMSHSMLKEILGLEKFNEKIWHQDGAKTSQADIVMDCLDQIYAILINTIHQNV